MALSHLLSIFLLWSLLLSTPTTALDITKILDQHPNYALFNQLLTKTGVAEEINKRKSTTVLVVPNSAMSGVATQDKETLKIVMEVHVVLDYYDSAKIKKVEDGTVLTTLYQVSGSADKDAGFLIVTKENTDIKLISAAPQASPWAKVSKVVTSIPSDLSIVEVSNPIVPPGLEGSPISPTPSGSSDSDYDSPAPSPRKQHKHHKAPAPSPSDSDDDGKDSDSPAPSPHRHGHKGSSSPAPSPHKRGHKGSDSPAPSPHRHGHKGSDSPAPSPHGHGHDHKHAQKHAPVSAPAPSDALLDGASDDADVDPDDVDANDVDVDAEEDAMAPDFEFDSSSPRNAIVSGFVLLASLFAML